MPRAGVSARPARPWWEELEQEAFSEFPAARKVRPAARAASSSSPPAGPAPEAGPSARAARPVRAPGQAPADRAPRPRATVATRTQRADRDLPVTRPTLKRHERADFHPDRIALWAVLLGLFLILVAVASAHV